LLKRIGAMSRLKVSARETVFSGSAVVREQAERTIAMPATMHLSPLLRIRLDSRL